jgi:membrane protease YdiL (CAAX protease family)
MSGAGTSHVRRIALAAVVLPALVVAAVAAGSYQPFAGDKGSEHSASTTFVDAVFTVAAVLLVALTGVLIWVALSAPKRDPLPRRPARSSLLGFIIYLGVITAAFLVLRHGLEQPPPVPKGEESADPAFPRVTVPPSPGRPAERSRNPQFNWPLAGGVAALIAAATAAIVAMRRRPQGLGPDREALGALGKILDEAIADLRAEPDPRRAVVASYARMEQALDVFGLPRHPAEAPYEYLARVGRDLQAERSISSLTQLFELAKFSSRPIGESMRSQAIQSLTTIRNEVRAAT